MVEVIAMQETRRGRLRAFLNAECGGNNSELARRTKKKQSYISDLLRGSKSFGEKVAREMEARLGLDAGYLDKAQDSPPSKVRESPPPYTAIAPDDYPALLAQRVRGWDEAQQLALLNFVETMNAAHRERQPRPRKGPTPHRQK
jgi:hypothetical protein